MEQKYICFVKVYMDMIRKISVIIFILAKQFSQLKKIDKYGGHKQC